MTKIKNWLLYIKVLLIRNLGLDYWNDVEWQRKHHDEWQRKQAEE